MSGGNERRDSGDEKSPNQHAVANEPERRMTSSRSTGRCI